MEFSLLSITTTLLIGAGCFAIGYLLAGAGLHHHDRQDAAATTRSCSRLLSWARSAVKGEAKSDGMAICLLSGEEDEGEDDDDDDEKEEAEGEEARQQQRRQRRDRPKQQQQPMVSPFLEIETLAEILEDFKMVCLYCILKVNILCSAVDNHCVSCKKRFEDGKGEDCCPM
ncbi:hypothetical protein Taro_036040 [Colocasia esculenta]|uniref:Uncharacterized protein n=1 Tax=Colocasia esculenta TaxID=4460 RepID=A0A843WF43_COLES|nr:hypothetical protein [Colocasia esculenta]